MMTPDLPLPITQQTPPPALEVAPVVHGQLPAPTAEQVQTSDQLFSEPADYGTVAGLVGLWTGLLLLHDLAAEHLASSREDEEPAGPLLQDEPVLEEGT